MKKFITKTIASVLSVSLCLSSMNLSVYANEESIILQDIQSISTGIEEACLPVVEETTVEEVVDESAAEESTEKEFVEEEIETAEVAQERPEESTGDETIEEEPEIEDSKETTQEDVLLDHVAEITVESGVIRLHDASEFVELSNNWTDEYCNKIIEIAPTDSSSEGIDLSNVNFNGFGTESLPFAGTLRYNGNYSGYIMTNKSLFNYISDEAVFEFTEGTPLYLKVAANNTEPLFAAKVVHGEAGSTSINLKIDALHDEDTYNYFGGIVGEMAEGSSLSLVVVNAIPVNKTVVQGTGNIGFFCNTMNKQAKLVVSYSGDMGFTVSTSVGHAGGIVGLMQQEANLTINSALALTGNVTGRLNAGGIVGELGDGASLTINQDISMSGEVSTTDTSAQTSSAGGLAGKATNAIISWDSSVQVTRGGSVICTEKSAAAGGFIGLATYSADTITIDLENYHIDTLILKNGHHTGGIFGALNYASQAGKLEIDKVNINSLKHTGKSWQFGGVIGQYSSAKLKNTLAINEANVDYTCAGTVTSVGGILAFMTSGSMTDGIKNAEVCYVEINGATVKAEATGSINTDGRWGGLVAEMHQGGCFLSVSGDVKISSDTICSKAPELGGIVGIATNGVLRISGCTDLSGLKFSKKGVKFGQIVGTISGTILYAKGSGNGDGVNEYDWKFIRPTTNTSLSSGLQISDIGTYGEVFRLDGETLKETTDDVEFTQDTSLIYYDAINHKIKVGLAVGSSVQIKNKRDLVALAIMGQCLLAGNKGAYIANGDASKLKSATITMDANLDIYLAGTGVVSLFRDNGINTDAQTNNGEGFADTPFTGEFNGNGSIIQLAIGETYGFSSADTPATNQSVGSGMTYNHNNTGFFGSMAGTVKNLKLGGFIHFSAGPDLTAYCGAIAGGAGSATLDTVDVATHIYYLESDCYNLGGFIGATTNSSSAFKFTDCTFSGTIEKIAGNWYFQMGGYIGYSKNSDISFSFDGCSLNGATIKDTYTYSNSQKVPSNSYSGGLIAVINGGNTTVSVNDFTVMDTNLNCAASGSAGGFLGYGWKDTTVTLNQVKIQNSSINTIHATKATNGGVFGGLVYTTSGYWKIGDGTNAGITFIKADEKINLFSGRSTQNAAAALLIAQTSYFKQKPSNKNELIEEEDEKTYIEILNNGLVIEDGSVIVTLKTDATVFDDITGRTKYGENDSSVVSIGLNGDLILQNDENTWTNKCIVNNVKNYQNKNSRYYYNVDQYRKEAGDSVETIDSGSDMLLWSLHQYAGINIKDYFPEGNLVSGTIDLSGISYYPVDGSVDIDNAIIIFDYEDMNNRVTHTNPNDKKLNQINSQHYQMHTGLFHVVTENIRVTDTTLRGVVGKYDDTHSGALICYEGYGTSEANVFDLSISGLTLDGLRISGVNDTTRETALLIGSIGKTKTNDKNGFASIRVSGVKQQNYADNQKAACYLIGAVGDQTAEHLNIDFSDMKLEGNTASTDCIFKNATFLRSFAYGDTSSGGTYNFNKGEENITYGLEISNGLNAEGHNRNSYNQATVVGQVWYYDTYGQTGPGSYVGINGPANEPYNIVGYLPYVYQIEEGDFHELDINQKAVFLDEGCGTYGDPYLVTLGEQLKAIADVIGGSGIGVALMIDDDVIASANGTKDAHLGGEATKDNMYIKTGDGWYPAVKNATGHYEKLAGSIRKYTDDQVITYIRNAYYQIQKDISIDVSAFNGIGGTTETTAFSGVIIGKSGDSTISFTGETSADNHTFGLIKYSQGSVVKDVTLDYSNCIVHIKVDANPGQSAEAQRFFGGVMGYALGGDNIIDNVSVIYGENSVKSSGDFAYLANMGGYVGLIGGQLVEGGGVIFRNIENTSPEFLVDGTTTGTNVDEGNYYYYRNPFIGRVLNGFACYDSAKSVEGTKSAAAVYLKNTDKNYQIVNLTGQILSCNSNTFLIGNAEQMWLIGAIVNSGAGETWNNSYVNIADEGRAYYYGKTRQGTYNGVGTSTSIENETYWGGIGYDSAVDKISYLYQYTSGTAKDLGASQSYPKYRIDLTADIDLAPYGNGFRGLSRMYKNAENNEALNRNARVFQLNIFKGHDTGGIEASKTVTMAMKMYEYTQDTIKVAQMGLAPLIRNGNNNQYKEVILSGEVSIHYSLNGASVYGTAPVNTDTYVGGFGGTNALSSGTVSGGIESITGYGVELNFESIQLKNLIVEGGMFTGGILGGNLYYEPYKHYVTVNLKGTNSYNNITVKSWLSAGGLIGRQTQKCIVNNCTGTNATIVYLGDAVGYSGKGGSSGKKPEYAGVGGLMGYQQNNFNINGNVTLSNITLIDGSSGSDTYINKHKLGIGGIVGTWRFSETSTLNNITLSNIDMSSEKGSFSMGGIVGSIRSSQGDIKSKPKTFNHVTMTDIKMSQASNIGGLIGYMYNDGGGASCGREYNFIDVKLSNIYGLYTKNEAKEAAMGGLVGYVYENNGCSNDQLYTLKADDIQLSDIYYYTNSNKHYLGGFIGRNYSFGTYYVSNATVKNSVFATKKASADEGIGICIGYLEGNATKNFKEITGYNILSKENVLGYYQGVNTVTVDNIASVLNKDSVGLYDGTNYSAYSSINLSSKSDYTSGNVGNWVGKVNEYAKIRLVGVQKCGETLCNEDIGSATGTRGDDYIIYSDYYVDQTNATSASMQPYLTVNPLSSLAIGSTVITGDGASVKNDDPIGKTIIDDITGSTYHPKHYNNISTDICSAVKEAGDLLTYSKFCTTENEYAAGEIPENSSFPVTVLTMSSSAEVNNWLWQYVSVLTNQDQTGTKRASSVSTSTYRWSGSAWVAAEVQTLTAKSSTELKLTSGAYDNTKHQITLIDVLYQNPANTVEEYHLYIPVVIKKVLQTGFSIKMLNGSSDYAKAYEGASGVLASYAENFTAQITFNYDWSVDEWNSNIAGGTNFLWSYDKQVKLGNSVGSLGKNTTRYTLVDMNRRGTGNTFFIGTGDVIDSSSGAVLKFNDLQDFSSVYLSDILPLKVMESEDGTLKKLANESGATIRVWNSNTNVFDYYGLKEDTDEADTKYYSITVSPDNALNPDKVTVQEVYYLTINCLQGNKQLNSELLEVITQDATFGLEKMTSTSSSALPVKQKSVGSVKYTLGDFYKIENPTISVASKNGTPLVELNDNDYIDVTVGAKLTVPEGYSNNFDAYGKGRDTFFQFAIQMYNDNKQSGSDLINPALCSVSGLKIGDTPVNSTDYSCTISNGVCYVIIKNKKGSDFKDKSVTATVRLSYEGDAAKIAAQFPMRNGVGDTSGINFSMDASVAYSLGSLDGTSMTGTVQNSTKFYREEISIAKLTYNSYSIASIDGNTSQLGINGHEVKTTNGQTITSLGMYDATQVTGLDFVNGNSARYPSKLDCKLELYKKNDEGVYEKVEISNYLTTITPAGNTIANGAYQFTVNLSENQVRTMQQNSIDINLSYFVKSDAELEKLGNVGQYANYKVVLSATLKNSSDAVLVDEVKDYIIYTNAKFYLGILSTTDFDAQ